MAMLECTIHSCSMHAQIIDRSLTVVSRLSLGRHVFKSLAVRASPVPCRYNIASNDFGPRARALEDASRLHDRERTVSVGPQPYLLMWRRDTP